ncbi:porin [Mesorhizobium sp. L-8-10]|uniref:porin n=1 Tax=unclassified Mesorhizobium TaxID=325217 RepID=UPI001926057E|nr:MULTISPECIES: porin [unclassified Mesorhizobium]BCH25926.1 porin [Mesorhizobium sp. L-8-3]BCH33910.1 porin [Mesorhizobium sp. L-8-10]
MTIKSLLLGSAAALVAVTGARAADAVVVAEPEPVEYVRVCDTYGAGFFYIPGTETCLRISGYVRYQIGSENYTGGVIDPDTGEVSGSTPDFLTYGAYPNQEGWLKQTRARVNFDARSETEWGLLRGYIRFQASWGDPFVLDDFGGLTGSNPFADGPVVTDQAYLDLGGFRAGYTESAWVESQKAGLAVYGSHSWGSMSYGDAQRHQMGYSFGSAEGFALTISLEDDALEGRGYVPDVVGVASYNQSWGAVWAKLGWEDDITGTLDIPGAEHESGWGAQVGMQWNIPNAPGSSLRLLGFYANSDTRFGVVSPILAITGGNGGAEWSILGSYYHQFTDKFGASVGAQYFNNFYAGGSDETLDLSGYEAEIALAWTPVTNFEIRTEVYYDKIEDLDGSVSGFLRFTRDF